MFQIDNSTAVAAIPAPTPAGSAGYFTDGNPATGVSATILPAEFMNMLMMENLNVLAAGGITPAKGQYNQLSLAIAKIVQSGAAGAASEATAGILKISTSPQVIAGTDDSTAVTPLKLLQKLASYLVQATEGAFGWLKIGTQAIVNAGTDDAAAVTAKKLATAIQAQAFTAFTTSGSAGALTLTTVPAIQAYATPLRFRVKFSQNSTGTDTINVSGLGPKSLKQYDSTGAKIAAVFAANQLADVEYDGTDIVLLDQLPPSAPLVHGQCRLAKSGANLVLSPFNGNKLVINGVPQAIPSAGVSLAATGLTVSALYYIYAYMSSGVMTLEASTTGHSTDTATGVEIKTGDATRTLVGMARPITGPAFQDAAAQRYVLSYFNRNNIVVTGVFASTFSTASTTYFELSSTVRCEFLTWANEPVSVVLNGTVTSLVGGSSLMYCGISLDGGSVSDGATICSSITANFTTPASPSIQQLATEGYHYSTIMGKATNSQTISVLGAASAPDRGILTTIVRG